MNKTYIAKNYNIDKIVSAKDLAKLSRSYQDNLETLIVMMKRKQPKPDVLQQILDKLSDIDTRLTNVEQILTQNKIDGILERNNLI